MTRTDVLRLIGALGWLLVMAMIGTERRLLRRLRGASAIDAQTAISLEPRSPLTRFRLRRLERAGAVLTTPSGRRYLDAAGFDSYRRARRKLALTILAVVLPMFALLAWYMASRQA
jgi:hypothetical protein